MKRIKEACICQTLHFQLNENLTHDYAVKVVQEEVMKYKALLDKSRTKYKIIEETTRPDGSVVIKLKKQYNNAPVGSYLD